MNLSQTYHKPIAILGSGSWGTALALYLGRLNQTVRIWSIDPTEIDEMLTEKMNNRYLPGILLPDSILPQKDLEKTVEGIEDILIVVPSIGFRQTLSLLKPYFKPTMRLICATKGIDAEKGQLLNAVATEILGPAIQYAVLSGPSFAREVAQGLPAAVVIAAHSSEFLSELYTRFNSPIFNITSSQDIIGVELGGIVKNVIAIATGISDGLSLGANMRSALITRGFAELIRLGTSCGGKLETFIGLSGLGDLILTCSDDQSRNRRLGLNLGKGLRISEIEKTIGQVIEGKRNAELVVQMAKKQNVKMPICEMVWELIQAEWDVKIIKEKMIGLLHD